MQAFPLLPVLGIVFIILKLTEVIAWSWVWVLAPFWIPLVIGFVVLLFMFMAAAYAAVRSKREDKHPLWETRNGVDRLRGL